MSQSNALQPLKSRLQKAIMELQSNQILHQMRNDKSLAQFKQQHIRQIIRQELQLEQLVQSLSAENEKLKELVIEKDELIKNVKEDCCQEIDNIARSWEQLQGKKELEKNKIEEQYKYDIKNLTQECKEIREDYLKVKNDVTRIRRENQSLKEEKARLQTEKSLAQQSILKLRKELEAKNRQLQTKEQQIGSQSQFEKSQYEQIIAKMQDDMHLIRQSWERKCEEIQMQLREQNDMMALEYEEKMRRELRQHAENLKLGKSVVINDSEEIIARRVEKVQQEFTEQIKNIGEEMEKLNKVYHAAKEEIEMKEKINKELKTRLKEHDNEIARLQKELDLKTQAYNFELEKIKIEKSKGQNDLKQLQEELKEIIKEKKDLKEENISMLKKQNTLTLQCERYQQEIQNLTTKKTGLIQTKEQQSTQLTQQRQELLTKEQMLHSKQVELQTLKIQLSQLKQSLRAQKSIREQISSSLRQQKQSHKKLLKVLDRLYLSVRKLKRQKDLLSEDVKSRFQMLKSRWSMQSTQLVEHCMQSREQVERKYKQRMSQLLDQMEDKEKELIQNISQEKEELKNELREKEQHIRQVTEGLTKVKTDLTRCEKEKLSLEEDLERYKIELRKLEGNLDDIEDKHLEQIDKAQRDWQKQMNKLEDQWSEKISKLQKQMLQKDGNIKICIQKIEELSGQLQEEKTRKDWAQNQTKKYKRKLQQLRHDRDDEVKGHLKRLDQQSKHRLNLQRQLKQMRLSLMRGGMAPTNSINNFSFNDKETGYQTNLKTYNSKQTYAYQKEKELSEIKDLIAKTNKYMGTTPSAERDIVRNISKKHLF